MSTRTMRTRYCYLNEIRNVTEALVQRLINDPADFNTWVSAEELASISKLLHDVAIIANVELSTLARL